MCKAGIDIYDTGKHIFAESIVDFIRYFILNEFLNKEAGIDGNFEDQNKSVKVVAVVNIKLGFRD